MSKTNKNKSTSHLGMPKAPWVYVNDPTPDSLYARKLASLIPDVLHFILHPAASTASVEIPKKPKSLVLITDPKTDHDQCRKIQTATEFKEQAIKIGANFASINIMMDMSNVRDIDNFGTNHLNIAGAPGISDRIYKWLCKNNRSPFDRKDSAN